MDLQNQKWSEDRFLKARADVLNQWPTGADVNLEQAVRTLEAVPRHKRFANVLGDAKTEGVTLMQPRAGVALVEEQIELLRHLQEQGGADLLPVTIDSYTRQNRYQECETGIEESRTTGRSMLNGFAAVNHGVEGCKRVADSVEAPLQARHGTPDARLLSEIIHAAGWTANEGGGISYNIPYAKKISLEKSILDWQYCDRLAGWYAEQGIVINREPFGPLTGTLVPPSISNAVMILEGLMAAEQGVKSLTLGYGQGGHLLQDVAALRSLAKQGAEYLTEYGYGDVELTTVFHQWMGGFPSDAAQAFGVVSAGAATAVLAGATKVIVKSPQEAIGVPTKEANAEGLRATKQILNMWRGQTLPNSKELVEEMGWIMRETKCILDHVYRLGAGDWAVGSVRAFAGGAIDVPFAPSQYNAGKMLPARDQHGAIRFLEFGNLPFDESIRSYHRERLEERARYEKREVSFQMVVDDIYAVSRGSLVGRPKR